MLQDHEPINVNVFGGLYSRDSFGDSTPADHFIDCLNVINYGNEVRTRAGFDKSVTFANIRRTAIYKREGEASRYLILDNSGQLFDASVSLETPILSITGMTDFSMVQQYNRCYITPHNGVKGLTGEFTYVYTGEGTARKAAGVKPVGSFTASISATAGDIEAGTHLFAWIYETDTGYLTQPSEAADLVFDGTKAVDFSNIPVGPSGTAKRHLIASRAIQDYNGNPEGYEMFLVATGIISNNTDTSLTAISFFDADLQVSADYLYDQLEEIPAGCFIGTYQNRIVVGGSNADPSLAWVSRSGEPESINALAGFITCDPAETEGIKAAVEYRRALYITKNGKTYVTGDNGSEPSTWPLDTVDYGIGADINGISVFLDQRGANATAFMVNDTSGLFLFTGTYDLSAPLTYKINRIWERINKAAFNKCQVVIDSKKFRIYVLLPLDDATTPSHIIVGDYSQGLNPTKIAWYPWSFAEIDPISIGVGIDATTKTTKLTVAGYDGNIYEQNESAIDDEGIAINHYIQFALLYTNANWVHHFGGITLRINGSGTLSISGYPMGLGSSITCPNLSLVAADSQERQLPINIINEKCSIKIALNSTTSYFRLREMVLYANPIWATRPF